MSASSTDPDDIAPVDRRWFEEALRSQGFVVEPPAEDVGFDPGSAALEAPDQAPIARSGPATTAGPEPPSSAVSVERPPMPSALLARIAARSQPPVAGPPTGAEPGPTSEATAPARPESIAEPQPLAEPQPIAEPEPQPIAEPEAIAEPQPIAGPQPIAETVPTLGHETVPAASTIMPGAERPAPWASAVEAPVAPWSAPAVGAPPPTAPLDEAAIDAPAPVSVAASLSEPTAAGGPAEPPGPGLDAVRAAPIGEPSGSVPDALLDGPPVPGTAVTAATLSEAGPVIPPAAPSAEASEGELWALVGASETTAAPASRSEAARIILTILTAFVILAIVVGSLVLVGQIA